MIIILWIVFFKNLKILIRFSLGLYVALIEAMLLLMMIDVLV
jgi:hypothetical protein